MFKALFSCPKYPFFIQIWKKYKGAVQTQLSENPRKKITPNFFFVVFFCDAVIKHALKWLKKGNDILEIAR